MPFQPDKVRQLISFLEENREHFAYKDFFRDSEDSCPLVIPEKHSCGTYACIAGHMAMLFRDEYSELVLVKNYRMSYFVSESLGIYENVAYGLIYAGCARATYDNAIARLNCLLETGGETIWEG